MRDPALRRGQHARAHPGLRLLLAVTVAIAAALAAGVVPVSAQSPTETTTAPSATTQGTVPTTPTVPRTTPTETTTAPPATTPETVPTTPVKPEPPQAAPPKTTPRPSPPVTRPPARDKPERRGRARRGEKDRDGKRRGRRRARRLGPLPDHCLRRPAYERWRRELRRRGRERDLKKLKLCKRGKQQRHKSRRRTGRRPEASPTPRPDSAPPPANPGYFDALPGPSSVVGVPNFVIRRFRVPVFLLPIYQAAGAEYGIRWEVLAAINEIETDYGRNLNVSSAGALGWMQFMPASWRAYGVDANEDGRQDPYNPVDAIFAAARYLNAADYERDVRGAIFAYNHANWYVDSVLLRARLIAGLPAEVVGSLTGLTEGRFPVAARARYAGDLDERDALRRVRAGDNAANVIESSGDRKSIRIFARDGAPVVAVNDGIVRKIARSRRRGLHLVLEDVYGNRFTYSQLREVAEFHPVPKEEAEEEKGNVAQAIAAHAAAPRPTRAASAGRQPDDSGRPRAAPRAKRRPARASLPVKRRLFAHPNHPLARRSGGLEQQRERRARDVESGFETYDAHFARPIELDAKDMRLKRLRPGSRVIGGTILALVGATVPGTAAHVSFEVRPAGRKAPRIDPKPILDGWKLLEATAIYRATGRNALHGDDGEGISAGQVLLLSKEQLERRVLRDERIELYRCGRDDIRSGQIDRRVLAALAYLAESGLRPTVTSLKCGHSYLTKSGNVSHHSSGNAVDIAQINGISVLGHQDRGGITEQAVRQLLRLQGNMSPRQVISLLELGGPTLAMADHADHIHVGFEPAGAGGSFAELSSRQWSDLIGRLGEIENPEVPTKPSRFALPARGRSADAEQRGD